MAEFPALPFFTDAYLADTRHLTTEEHGAYLLLLMCAWRTRGCALRDEDRLLARIAGVSANKWRKLKPVMMEFFSIEDGYWRQKKLSQTYETVSKKVERNRANGAKGGRAKSRVLKQASFESKYLKSKENKMASANFSSGWSHVVGASETALNASANALASKTITKTKTKEGNSSCKGNDVASPLSDRCLMEITPVVAAAARIDETKVDRAVLVYWFTCGAILENDILPTINRLRERELKRTGQVPYHMSYYSAAILEQRAKRIGALSKAEEYVSSHPPKPALIKFNTTNPDHWRRFLGDKASRFRGEYLSRHWCIPMDHAVFMAADLGPDPCHRTNSKIPEKIYQEYGGNWNWRPRVGAL